MIHNTYYIDRVYLLIEIRKTTNNRFYKVSSHLYSPGNIEAMYVHDKL